MCALRTYFPRADKTCLHFRNNTPKASCRIVLQIGNTCSNILSIRVWNAGIYMSNTKKKRLELREEVCNPPLLHTVKITVSRTGICSGSSWEGSAFFSDLFFLSPVMQCYNQAFFQCIKIVTVNETEITYILLTSSYSINGRQRIGLLNGEKSLDPRHQMRGVEA